VIGKGAFGKVHHHAPCPLRPSHPRVPRFASSNTKRARNFMRSSTWTNNSA
jgi:hypothetical protein